MIRILPLLVFPIASLPAASASDLIFTPIDGGDAFEVSSSDSYISGALAIPANHNNRPVTSIGDYAFMFRSSLTSVTIPSSVTSIGDGAFSGCEGLTSVNIPDGVTSIGDNAFATCGSLASITIPDGVTSIGFNAFGNCGSLTSITIPDSVNSIGESAFAYCRSLASITIPNVTSIGLNAFIGCTSLTSITLLATTPPTIDENAFGNTSAVEIVVPAYATGYGPTLGGLAVSYFIDLSFNLIEGGVYELRKCSPTASGVLTIPATHNDLPVTRIGDEAFNDCSDLTSIIIPDSVSSIGEEAFGNCTSLASITIPDSVTSIGEAAFRGCTSLTNVTLPDMFGPSLYHIGMPLDLIPDTFFGAVVDVLKEDSEFISAVAQAMLAAESNSGFATKEELPLFVAQGVKSVTDAPGLFNLATAAEVAAARTAGRQDVLDDPLDFELIAESQILDARPGATKIDVADGEARITMTLEETSDLSDWSNPTKTDHTIEIDAPAEARFYRFKMRE